MSHKINKLIIAGAHRGGRAFTDSYLERFTPPSTVVVADPKNNRARILADEWARKGANASGYAVPCEEAVKQISDDFICVLSVDSILPMGKVIGEAGLPVQWQILGQSTGNVIVGLSGTLPSEDQDLRADSALLLKNLSPYSISKSSWHVRASLVNNRMLSFTRKKVSDYSAESIPELANGRTSGELRLFFATQNFPLLVLKGEIEPFIKVEKRALEVEDSKIADSRKFAVAVVLTNQVELFVIETLRNKRAIKFYTTFGDVVSPERKQAVSSVVTD